MASDIPAWWRMEAVPSSLRLRNQRQTRGVDCRDMTTHLEGDVGCLYAGSITLRLCVRRHTGDNGGHGLWHPGVWRMEAVPS